MPTQSAPFLVRSSSADELETSSRNDYMQINLLTINKGESLYSVGECVCVRSSFLPCAFTTA